MSTGTVYQIVVRGELSKALLRRAGARTREALLEAKGSALDAVTTNDARGFFEHRGYHAAAQLL